MNSWCEQLIAGRSVQIDHQGDRLALFESLLGLLPESSIPCLSFTTSLRASLIRPFRLGPAIP
jgi:hypothetical protein